MIYLANSNIYFMKDQAFGIIPVLVKDQTHLFLLIQHHDGHWGFPKGHAENGESPLESACREFEEETGLMDYTVWQNVSFQETYSFNHRGQTIEKTVVYFPAQVNSGTVTFQEAEIQNYAWVTFDEALKLITYPASQGVLRAANDYCDGVIG